MSTALIVVDVQNDFCEGGSLGVSGGSAVAEAISRHVAAGDYAHVVATRDYHIDPGGHFSDHPDFVDSWPVHCVAGTPGASFHPALDVAPVEAVFSKGHHSAAYSGFEGRTDAGTDLAPWLRAHDVDKVEIVGIATDFCVRATALDAVNAGFGARVLLDLTAAVSGPGRDKALRDFAAAGVEVTGGA